MITVTGRRSNVFRVWVHVTCPSCKKKSHPWTRRSVFEFRCQCGTEMKVQEV